MITLDGSHGEGGGQIVRSALTLSAITGQAVRIEAIRAGRAQPGLQAQHLTAVWASAAVCEAAVSGDALGSTCLEFMPRQPPQAGTYTFDVSQARRGSSAGSIALVFQTLCLPLAHAGDPSQLVLQGGTHVAWSPPVPYLKHVFLPAVWCLGLRAGLALQRYGWYPAGGGQAEFNISPLKVEAGRPAFQLVERGELKKIWGTAAVSNLPSHIAQRMASRAANVIKAHGLGPVNIQAEHVEATGPGVGIFLFAEYQHVTAGFCAYGRKGWPAEKVAESACGELAAYHDSQAAADPHLADQLVLPVTLLAGPACWTTSRVTQHLLTNVWVAQQFIERRIEVSGAQGQAGKIVVS